MSLPKKVVRLGRRVQASGDSSNYGLEKHRFEEQEQLVTVPLENFARHVCIFGRTGVGKSVTGMVIAKELSAMGGVSVLVLDRTGEFANSPLSTLPGATVYNPGANLTLSPFARKSDNPKDDVERGISLMHHFVGSTFKRALFTPFQDRALRDALTACYGRGTSRLSEMLSQLEEQGENSRDKAKGWLEGNQAVISRLTPLASGSMAQVFDTDEPGLSETELFEPGLKIVNLGALDTDESRNMLSQVLCKLLTVQGKRLGMTKEVRFVLIVDEAQHLAPNRDDYEGVLEKYAVELRKYGMGVVAIATRPTLVSEDVTANAGTIICHSMTSGKDIKLALNYMVSSLAAEKFEEDLRTLDVGECLVQLNDESTVIPAGCKVGLPEHAFLLSPLHVLPKQALPSEESPKTPPIVLTEVSEGDSARATFEKLPPWARDVAKIIHDSGGRMPRKRLVEKGYSNKQMKQMVHGRHPLLEPSGNDLVLTKLGEKIVAISCLTGVVHKL